MAHQPFTARRSRRCALDGLCRLGGRIAPGDQAVRYRPHAYCHADCLDQAAWQALADALARLPELVAEAVDRFAAFAETVRPVVAAAVERLAPVLTLWEANATVEAAAVVAEAERITEEAAG